MNLHKPVPASRVAETLVAIALLLWRIWAVPVVSLWRDWVTLLAVFWLLETSIPAGRAKTHVTIGAAAGLMLLYGWGQFPHVLALLRAIT